MNRSTFLEDSTHTDVADVLTVGMHASATWATDFAPMSTTSGPLPSHRREQALAHSRPCQRGLRAQLIRAGSRAPDRHCNPPPARPYCREGGGRQPKGYERVSRQNRRMHNSIRASTLSLSCFPTTSSLLPQQSRPPQCLRPLHFCFCLHPRVAAVPLSFATVLSAVH